MSLDEEKINEIKTLDEDGNQWKISMTRMETKTNRFKLSFYFNDKEFVLSKLQSNRSAQDTWELLERIKNTQPMNSRKLYERLSLNAVKPTVKSKKESASESIEEEKKNTAQFYAEIKKGRGRPKKVSAKEV